MDGEGSPPPHRQSPYSPFPFGSPLGLSDVLNPSIVRSSTRLGMESSSGVGTNGLSALATVNFSSYPTFSSQSVKGRVRAQEAYGGPVMFGGQRKSRLMAASPYAAAALSSRKLHQRPIFDESSSRRGSSAAATPSPAPSPSPSSTTSDNGIMSSTARLIFDTLERMSTPVRDAQKLIPSVSCSPPRAEKRRLIAEQLDWSQEGLKRRRPQLRGATNSSVLSSSNSGKKGLLNGPPLRTVFSPVSASPRTRSTATKSARINATTVGRSVVPSTPLSSRVVEVVKTSANVPAMQPPPFSRTATIALSPYSSSEPSTSAASVNTVASFSRTAKFGHEQPVNSRICDKKLGGKMRAKVAESTRQKAVPEDEIPAFDDPVASFLALHNNALPIKDMPSFNFGKSTATAVAEDNKPAPPSRSTTASTLPLSSPFKLEDSNFEFASPSPVSSVDSNFGAVQDGMVNGIVFSFCPPEEVSSKSSSPFDSLTGYNRAAAVLPDLTANVGSPPAHSSVASSVKSLMKGGSVMDVLGGNHRLPDVTASSAGVKVAPELKNRSVMSILGGGSSPTSATSNTWEPSFKMTKKPWH